jgi:outer membrane murein-binding lipoprotein Lpp
MSYELSELKFNVNTEKLAEAVKMVKDLAAAVKGLEKPLEGMGTAASAAGAAVEKGTEKVPKLLKHRLSKSVKCLKPSGCSTKNKGD